MLSRRIGVHDGCGPRKQTMEFLKKRYLVTGASSGLGRATAQYLANNGARIALVARDEGRLQTVCTELAGEGHVVKPCDLRDLEAIPALIDAIVVEGGPLDGLVHCAGVHLASPLRTFDPERYRWLMDLNVGAALALAKGFRKKGNASPGSSLVFVSSVMGLVGQPAVSTYSASKGALLALAKSLAVELAREGLRVNCVTPGQVETDLAEQMQAKLTEDQYERIRALHPLGLGRPEDVAHAIGFLLSEEARWITGASLVVDGGYTAM
jgi:NAD(P)-dependent dehydrogenase (short-subunit alcohol dehydrogenase family)